MEYALIDDVKKNGDTQQTVSIAVETKSIPFLENEMNLFNALCTYV